jgi:hypothetical protein
MKYHGDSKQFCSPRKTKQSSEVEETEQSESALASYRSSLRGKIDGLSLYNLDGTTPDKTFFRGAASLMARKMSKPDGYEVL